MINRLQVTVFYKCAAAIGAVVPHSPLQCTYYPLSLASISVQHLELGLHNRLLRHQTAGPQNRSAESLEGVALDHERITSGRLH